MIISRQINTPENDANLNEDELYAKFRADIKTLEQRMFEATQKQLGLFGKPYNETTDMRSDAVNVFFNSIKTNGINNIPNNGYLKRTLEMNLGIYKESVESFEKLTAYMQSAKPTEKIKMREQIINGLYYIESTKEPLDRESEVIKMFSSLFETYSKTPAQKGVIEKSQAELVTILSKEYNTSSQQSPSQLGSLS